MPEARCTGTAPTTSSISNRSSNNVTTYITTAEIIPIRTALEGLTIFADAVTPTSPASEPFIIIGTSTCLFIHCDITNAIRPPNALDMNVFTIIPGTSGVRPSVLPPLNPIHPNQRMKTPSATNGRSCPWIFTAPLPNLRRRGPIIIIAASAIQPPIECTTVDPAKSRKPNFPSHPPLPQTQCPKIG